VRFALAALIVLSAWAARAEPAKHVVVLDPGHGGTNTGAPGVVPGLYEKRLTLILAREIAARLQKTPGVTVELTRDDDRFVSLRERVRRANHAGAELFISIHANASSTHAQRGYETWVLTPEALAVDAEAIRGGDGPPRPGLDPEIADLVDDIERGAVQPLAVRLAERVQAHLAEVRGSAGNRGVQQGTQDVLMGPTMPAVLVEVGFIDHATEGVELLRHEVREKIADAIAAAIVESLQMR
jgi:N-acetylmuramoyl-L-alanine amidase